MLSPADDFPIHQIAAPAASTLDGDPNRYDRYFFNGFDLDAGIYVGATLGVYPNREVIDAAFSIVIDGVQRSIFASGRAPLDRTETSVGPITVEVIEPLRILRVAVDSPEHDLRADLTFGARTPAVQEPQQTLRDRNRVVMDSTRLTQWGAWAGTVRVGETIVDVDPGSMLGVRDRSWGIRPLGGGPEVAPSGRLPEVFWMWTPVHLPDRCLHGAVMEDSRGVRSMDASAIVGLAGEGDPVYGPELPIEHGRSVTYDIDWEPGTRRARAATIAIDRYDADPLEVRLTPRFRHQMRGLGYTHLEWGHGLWRGEDFVAAEELKLDELDPTDFQHLHVHQVCEVAVGEETGVGILELLAIGPHAPSGLTGFIDGAEG